VTGAFLAANSDARCRKVVAKHRQEKRGVRTARPNMADRALRAVQAEEAPWLVSMLVPPD
jgi:hypothetical protein